MKTAHFTFSIDIDDDDDADKMFERLAEMGEPYDIEYEIVGTEPDHIEREPKQKKP
jgi:uncharacterized glyoxalase superfamily protein PhnB